MNQHKYSKFLKELGFNLLLAQIELIRKRKIGIPATDKQVEPTLEDRATEEGKDVKKTPKRRKSKAGDS